MSALTKSFGTIRVRHEDAPDSDCIILNFATRDAYDDCRRALMKSVGVKIVDEFFGYALYSDADEAMGAVRAFCRAPVKVRA